MEKGRAIYCPHGWDEGFEYDELKPCPCCGGEAELKFKGNDWTKTRSVTIKCKKCRLQRTDGAIKFDSKWCAETCIDLWNKREEKKVERSKLAKYTIGVCLVPAGYEIDMLDHKKYLDGRVVIEHSECRDFGGDIDVGDRTVRLLNFVRLLESNKPVCSCGKEMKKVDFKGYYDEFDFWECEDGCDISEGLPVDEERFGAYS